MTSKDGIESSVPHGKPSHTKTEGWRGEKRTGHSKEPNAKGKKKRLETSTRRPRKKKRRPRTPGSTTKKKLWRDFGKDHQTTILSKRGFGTVGGGSKKKAILKR